MHFEKYGSTYATCRILPLFLWQLHVFFDPVYITFETMLVLLKKLTLFCLDNICQFQKTLNRLSINWCIVEIQPVSKFGRYSIEEKNYSIILDQFSSPCSGSTLFDACSNCQINAVKRLILVWLLLQEKIRIPQVSINCLTWSVFAGELFWPMFWLFAIYLQASVSP